MAFARSRTIAYFTNNPIINQISHWRDNAQPVFILQHGGHGNGAALRRGQICRQHLGSGRIVGHIQNHFYPLMAKLLVTAGQGYLLQRCGTVLLVKFKPCGHQGLQCQGFIEGQ